MHASHLASRDVARDARARVRGERCHRRVLRRVFVRGDATDGR